MRTKSSTDPWRLIGEHVAQVVSTGPDRVSLLQELVDDLAIAFRHSHGRILFDWQRWLACNELSCLRFDHHERIERAGFRFLQWRHRTTPFGCLHQQIREQFSAVVSSHVGRFADWHSTWFQNIENAIRRIAEEDQQLLVFPATAAGEWIEQVCCRLGVRYERFELSPNNSSLDDWLQACFERSLETDQIGNDAGNWRSCFPLLQSIDQDGSDPSSQMVPLNDTDYWSVFLPHVVHAVFVRAKGKIEQLLSERLLTSPSGTTRVYAISEALGHSEPKQQLKVLIDLGAVQYIDTPVASFSNSSITPPVYPPYTLAPICSGEQWLNTQGSQWNYLTHCTRSRSGRWPDQSEWQYLDSVLLGSDDFSSDPLTTLSRILKQKKIIGSGYLMLDSVEMVCWSEQPLEQLLAQRKYQRHLGRWDWEPYGLCIRKSLAEKRGARKVEYGPQEMSNELPESARIFFQPLVGGRGKVRHDWAGEREWRTRGDFRLAEIAFEDLIVFVRTKSEAAKIAGLSHWPVIYLQD